VLVEQRRFVPTRPRAALTGALAAIAALATGELVSAVAGSQVTLVTAVGNQLVDSLAGSLKDFAVALFGTNDKLALVIGIIVVSIGVAALLGVVSRRWWAAAPLGIAAFGVVGAVLLARDPLGGTGVAVASGATAVAIGWAVLAGLWWSAARATAGAEPDTPALDRRSFLVGAGGTAVVSLAGWYVARRIRAGDSVESVRRSTTLPRPRRAVGVPASQPFEAPGLTSYVTSSDDFYRIDTALLTPQVDASGWELRIHGMVDRPFTLSYDELLGLDSVEVPVTIQCVSNEVGGHLVGNAVWQGVPLADLLERAGVQDRAEQVFSRSTDDWTCGFPLADAVDGRTALVAYAMNGEALRAEHGYPARLIVAGLYGYVSATKWLREIELTRWDGVDGYWVPRGWSKRGPIKTASRIDVPNGSVTAGAQPIAGVAWAPDRGIARVEVQVDDGPWRECRLGRTANDDTWVQWWLDWDATPGSHTVRVRATDRAGVTQTDERRAPAPDGATGWHTRTVTVA
jgi:DMSO/TMAO reductase YedYZ molybdopterin-dependent catalytic subunit